MDDSRIPKFRQATRAMSEGDFNVEIPLGGADEVAELGRALRDLGRVLERKFDELQRLVQITEQVNAGLILEDVLDHIFESFHPVIPYDRIGVALLDDDGDRVRTRWARSRATQIRLGGGYSAPLGGSSLEEIIATGEPRILNDLPGYLAAHPESHSTRLIVEEGMCSSFTCPLIAMRKRVGFIFFSSAERDTYRDEHAALYKQIAGQISTVIEKGKLYQQLLEMTAELEQRNAFIRKQFGRYISDEVVEELLESPGALELGGSKRRVTLLMTDLRGFTAMTEDLPASDVVGMLNAYLAVMVDVILAYRGTITAFIGDALLVVFGALMARDDDTERALACALAMQAAMARVNAQNRERGWPEIEMGIGVNTGDVVVGNIGSDKRAQYSVVGRAVNVAARIESYTVGGQCLVAESTVRAAADSMVLGARFEIQAKGVRDPVPVHELLSVTGKYEIGAPVVDDPWTVLETRVPILYAPLEGKHVTRGELAGHIERLSSRRAVIVLSEPLPRFANLRFRRADEGASSEAAEVYAKVVESDALDPRRVTSHFTSLSTRVRAVLGDLLDATR